MAIDFTKPALTDNYTSAFVPNILANTTALARLLDSGVESISGTPPLYVKRYDRASSALTEWNGSAWVNIPLQGIYFSGGNIGLGSASSPSNLLHLRAPTNPVIRLESAAGGSGFLDFDATRFVVSAGGGYLSLVAGNAERVRLPAAGGLLVNRTSDSGLGPLQVFDSAGALGDFSSSFAGTALFRVRHSGAQLVGLAVQNSFTGTDGASGLQLLVDPAGGAYVAQREAQPLYLQTDGTTRISIDGAGAVDVLQAMRVRSDLNVYGASSDRLVVSPQAAGGGALVRATNNANSAFAPLILDGSTVLLYVAGAERGRVDSTGFVGGGAGLTSLNASNVSTGTLPNARTTGTAAATASTLALRDGSGDAAFRALALGNTAVASPTLLDWFEEGTWTPTVVGATTAGAASSYPVQSARYLRMGRLVYVEIELQWSGHTGSGLTRIQGLPWAAAFSRKTMRAVAGGSGLAADAWSAETVAGQTYLQLYGINQNTGANSNRSIAANDTWWIQGFYEV